MSRAAYEIHAAGEVPRDMLEDFGESACRSTLPGPRSTPCWPTSPSCTGCSTSCSRGGFQLVDVRREAFDAWEDGSP